MSSETFLGIFGGSRVSQGYFRSFREFFKKRFKENVGRFRGIAEGLRVFQECFMGSQEVSRMTEDRERTG